MSNTEPPEQVASFPAFHGTEPFLQCTYAQPACGCKIVGAGTLPHPLRIEWCALHKEAHGFEHLLDVLIDYLRQAAGVAERTATLSPAEILILMHELRASMHPEHAQLHAEATEETEGTLPGSCAYRVVRNAARVCVKGGLFFEEQGGLREEWGKNWKEIFAGSLEEAKKLGDLTLPPFEEQKAS